MASPQNKRNPPRRDGGGSPVLRIERRPEPDAPPAVPEPLVVPLAWFKALVGVVLLPMCWIATVALFAVFERRQGGSLWHSEEVWLFSAGFLAWVLAFLFLPRPTGIYVVGHELTHAVFVWLCGGRVGRIHTTSEGGYILSDRNNFLISLSPYIIPFWTLVSLALLAGARLALDIPWFDRILFFSTGVTWAFHVTFTIDMIRKGQSDIEENGRFFSLSLIYLCNMLLISGLLVIASPAVSLVELGSAAADEAFALFRSTRELFQ
jgi:hypothetical protein